MQSFDSFFVVSLSKIAEQAVELLVVQDIQAKPLFTEDALDTIAWSLLSCMTSSLLVCVIWHKIT